MFRRTSLRYGDDFLVMVIQRDREAWKCISQYDQSNSEGVTDLIEQMHGSGPQQLRLC